MIRRVEITLDTGQRILLTATEESQSAVISVLQAVVRMIEDDEENRDDGF